MVKIGANGLEYDNMVIHSTTLTRTTSSMTENGKRIQINIDYSSPSSLTGAPHVITITNSEIDAKDTILANVISGGGGHEEIFISAFSILDNEMKLTLKALGPGISSMVNVVILIIT